MAQQKKDKERFSAFLDELGKRLNKFRKSVLKTLGRATVLATIHGLGQRHELAGLFILYTPLPFFTIFYDDSIMAATKKKTGWLGRGNVLKPKSIL